MARKALADIEKAITDLTRVRRLLDETTSAEMRPGTPLHEWQMTRHRVEVASIAAEEALVSTQDRYATAAWALGRHLAATSAQVERLRREQFMVDRSRSIAPRRRTPPTARWATVPARFVVRPPRPVMVVVLYGVVLLALVAVSVLSPSP